MIPSPIPVDGADYSKSDLKMQKRLCDMEIYPVDPALDKQSVAICPKLFSTFPALEFFEIPKDETQQSVEEKFCSQKVGEKTRAKKIAKYKYSMSCAKTSSILSYYHISRALQMNSVPVSVLRTVDKQTHMFHAELGVKRSRASASEIISKNWVSVVKLITQSNPDIVTPDQLMTYGALSENPRGEQKYYEDFWPKTNGDQGVKNFKSTEVMKRLALARPVESFIATELNTNNYSSIRKMKDASDMVILDTLFGQKDRFGNIHSYHSFMVNQEGDFENLDLGDIEDWMAEVNAVDALNELKKVKDWPSDWQKEILPRNKKIIEIVSHFLNSLDVPFAHSQVLLIKDNDCGFKGSNIFKSQGLVKDIRHLSLSTYQQLNLLFAETSQGHLDDYFIKTLNMSEEDVKSFKENLTFVYETLKVKCDKKELFLDLNIKSHFRKENSKESRPCA